MLFHELHKFHLYRNSTVVLKMHQIHVFIFSGYTCMYQFALFSKYSIVCNVLNQCLHFYFRPYFEMKAKFNQTMEVRLFLEHFFYLKLYTKLFFIWLLLIHRLYTKMND